MTTLEPGQAAFITKPTGRFMLSHPAHWLAQGFGSGLSPVLPGTSGTLFAWLSFAVLTWRWPEFFTPLTWAIVICIGFVIGIWACEITGRNLGIADHGSMVWDEVIAFWVVLLFIMPGSLEIQAAAFFIFRFFDMLKPPPIAYFDRHLKGGFGVMFDDMIATFYTLLIFAIWQAI